MSLRFRPEDHLRSSLDFSSIYARKESVRNRSLTIYYRPSECGRSRLGLSVSRRVGNAVARNRVKRVIREVFRHCRGSIPGELDLVVIPRHHTTSSRFEDVRSAFEHLMRKIRKRRDEVAS